MSNTKSNQVMEFLFYWLSDRAANFMYHKGKSTLCIKEVNCTMLTAASSDISEDSPCTSNQKSHTMSERGDLLCRTD